MRRVGFGFLFSVVLVVAVFQTQIKADPGNLVIWPAHGGDSAPSINHALSISKKVELACGVYSLHESILLPSGARLVGRGACTILRAVPGAAASMEWAQIAGASKQAVLMLTNQNFNLGNEDIEISSFTLDARLYTMSGHIAGFYRVRNVTVSNVVFLGGGNPKVFDGLAFVGSRDYRVYNNSCDQVKTACFDNWGGDRGFDISNNLIQGLGGFSSYGVLVNGADTNRVPNISLDGNVDGNIVRDVSQGVFVGGLKIDAGHGGVENIVIKNNQIINVDDHGIRVADGRLISVVGNTVNRSGKNCLLIGSEGGGGATEEIRVEGNVFVDCAFRDPSADAVNIYSGASHIKYFDNWIRGRRQRYAIRVDETVTNSEIDPGNSDAGVYGLINNFGKNITIMSSTRNKGHN